MAKVQRAVLSVANKTGLIEFARGLVDLGITLISTSGTLNALRDARIYPRDLSDVTGFPEILAGRVKTLHPKIHAGILARRDSEAQMDILEKLRIETIDLVCVNLYPFEQTIAKQGCLFEEARENIDVGGPTMIRAAGKNFESVYVVTDPSQYASVLEMLRANNCEVDRDMAFKLMKAAFYRTAMYDKAISDYLDNL